MIQINTLCKEQLLCSSGYKVYNIKNPSPSHPKYFEIPFSFCNTFNFGTYCTILLLRFKIYTLFRPTSHLRGGQFGLLGTRDDPFLSAGNRLSLDGVSAGRPNFSGNVHSCRQNSLSEDHRSYAGDHRDHRDHGATDLPPGDNLFTAIVYPCDLVSLKLPLWSTLPLHVS